MKTLLVGLVFTFFTALVVGSSAAAGAELIFATPEDAVGALVASLEAEDCARFLSVVGVPMAEFWKSGDPLRDTLDRDRLLDAARLRVSRIDAVTPDRRLLYLGRVAAPFPAPLVRTNSGWRFDGDAGAVELRTRRIQRNESAVVELCQRLREAEFTYLDRSDGGFAGFATRIRSNSNQHDGLFWVEDGGDESPLGPVFASAAYTEAEPNAAPQPLFGYYFRLLPAPVARANTPPDTFAFIAWPAEYHAGGIRSFLITQSGEVFQKDLGPNGGRFARDVTAISVAQGWNRVKRSASIARAK